MKSLSQVGAADACRTLERQRPRLQRRASHSAGAGRGEPSESGFV